MYTKVEHHQRPGERNAGKHDGFKTAGTEGGYVFVEGVKTPRYILTYQEVKNVNACAKRRGIGGGYFVIDNPRENNCNTYPTPRYHL